MVCSGPREVLQQSKARNTVNKRGKQREEQQQQQQQQSVCEGDEQNDESVSGSSTDDDGRASSVSLQGGGCRAGGEGVRSDCQQASKEGGNLGEEGLRGNASAYVRGVVVVAVVGEPNVGKSSTMNLLLGTHKVSWVFMRSNMCWGPFGLG